MNTKKALFLDFIRIAAYLQPKVILIENVPGIVSMDKGGVITAIYRELATTLEYVVQHKILLAAHYGVPQLRYRTIFLAVRSDLAAQGVTIDFPSPTHHAQCRPNFASDRNLVMKTHPMFSDALQPQVSVWDAISDLPSIAAGVSVEAMSYAASPQNTYQAMVRQDIVDVHNHHAAGLAPINLARLKHIPQGGSWRDIPFDLLPAGMQRARRSDHTKRYGRLDPQGLCSTILTKCDPHWGCFFHPYQDRVLSVREAARMQSFPDSYVFLGTMGHQYAQVGNAVPPLLARALGMQIARALRMANDVRCAAD